MKNLFYTLIFILAAGCLSSCEDMFGSYLDKAPGAELEEDVVFSDWKRTEYYHNDIYNFLRNGLGRINNSWLDSATDLAMTSYSWGGVRTSLNLGNYYASSGAPEVHTSWRHYYEGIRKVNTFLARVDNVPLGADETAFSREQNVRRLKAEARFLRAWFYWELTLRYGGVPMITQRLSPADEDILEHTRETYESCVEWIVSELVDCEEGLSFDDAIKADQLGRITKGMNLALRSRISLYMASPRNNPTNDLNLWKKAVDDAMLMMTEWGHLASVPVYYLHTVGGADKAQAYQQALTLRRQNGNPETIFWRNDAQGDWWQFESPVSFGGYGGLCPSQNLIDMYDMENGQSPFTQYDETGAPVYGDPATGTPSGINAASGYNPAKPYSGRDPRFYKTVLYNGATWWDTPIATYEGGKDKPNGNLDATATGYYNRKYMDDSQTHYLNGGTMYRNWVIIRYAEILLNYAEALNEYSGPVQEVYDVLQMIRARAGFRVSVATSHPGMSQSEMQSFIRRERAVELCFEEHRWWDVRRWDIAEQVLSRPVYGMSITLNDDNSLTYRRTLAQNRVFEQKMYLYPIPREEVWRTGMDNNPGW